MPYCPFCPTRHDLSKNGGARESHLKALAQQGRCVRVEGGYASPRPDSNGRWTLIGPRGVISSTRAQPAPKPPSGGPSSKKGPPLNPDGPSSDDESDEASDDEPDEESDDEPDDKPEPEGGFGRAGRARILRPERPFGPGGEPSVKQGMRARPKGVSPPKKAQKGPARLGVFGKAGGAQNARKRRGRDTDEAAGGAEAGPEAADGFSEEGGGASSGGAGSSEEADEPPRKRAFSRREPHSARQAGGAPASPKSPRPFGPFGPAPPLPFGSAPAPRWRAADGSAPLVVRWADGSWCFAARAVAAALLGAEGSCSIHRLAS